MIDFPLSAIIMFLFGSIVLYGGFAYFLFIALRKKNNEKDLNETNR